MLAFAKWVHSKKPCVRFAQGVSWTSWCDVPGFVADSANSLFTNCKLACSQFLKAIELLHSSRRQVQP
jgi:hypothetical protein